MTTKISHEQLWYLNTNRGIIDEYMQAYGDINGTVADSGAVAMSVYSWSSGTRVLINVHNSNTGTLRGKLYDWRDLL